VTEQTDIEKIPSIEEVDAEGNIIKSLSFFSFINRRYGFIYGQLWLFVESNY